MQTLLASEVTLPSQWLLSSRWHLAGHRSLFIPLCCCLSSPPPILQDPAVGESRCPGCSFLVASQEVPGPYHDLPDPLGLAPAGPSNCTQQVLRAELPSPRTARHAAWPSLASGLCSRGLSLRVPFPFILCSSFPSLSKLEGIFVILWVCLLPLWLKPGQAGSSSPTRFAGLLVTTDASPEAVSDGE